MSRQVEILEVPVDPRGLLPRLAAALAGTGPALLPLGANDPRAAAIAASLAAGSPLGIGEDDDADPTALVMPTSGSTGLPKGVLLSAAQLAASAAATEQRLGGPGSWLLALPAQHIAGMQVLLRAARAGTEPVVMSGPFSAGRFAERSRLLTGNRRYVSLVPTQLARVLAEPRIAAEISEIFHAILVGGAATAPQLLADAGAAGLPVCTSYGMTETCGGCIYDGVPLAGVRAAEHRSGALALTGPMVARGYRGLPGHAAFATPGTFVTSDIGEVTCGADGRQRIAVTGRIDDMIISGGVNIAPVTVEQALLTLPGMRGALVIGVPDDRWGQVVAALIVSDDPDPWTVDRLRDGLDTIPRSHRPHLVRQVRQIPMLASGKPDRVTARALFVR